MGNKRKKISKKRNKKLYMPVFQEYSIGIVEKKE